MKKTLSALLSALLFCMVLASCSTVDDSDKSNSSEVSCVNNSSEINGSEPLDEITEGSNDESGEQEESSEIPEEVNRTVQTLTPEEPVFDLSEFSPIGTKGATKIIVRFADIGDTIKTSLFQGNKDITDVYIEDGIINISKHAFSGCSSLKNIRLPRTLKTLGEDMGGVFAECSSLESIYIPDGITGIEKETFYDCASLKYVRLPNTLKSIELWAFQGTSITSIKLPDSLKSIGRNALPSFLEALVLPDNVTYIFNVPAKVIYVKAGSVTQKTVLELIGDYGLTVPIEVIVLDADK